MSKAMDTAKQAYQDFFRLWAHADERLPILIRAKAEFAGLGK
jgi:hypothetical protein